MKIRKMMKQRLRRSMPAPNQKGKRRVQMTTTMITMISKMKKMIGVFLKLSLPLPMMTTMKNH